MAELHMESGRGQSVTSSPARLTPDHHDNVTSSHRTSSRVHFQPDVLTSFIASDKWFRVKLVVGLCCGIFLCHTLLVILVGNTSVSDVTERELYSPSNVDQEKLTDNRRDRVKRDLTWQDSVWSFWSTGRDTCASGHISALAPICDNSGCLRKLYKDPTEQDPETSTSGISLEDDSGNVKVYHLILQALTSLQRRSGIYGSVGVFNSHGAAFLRRVTSNLDLFSGERVFTTDHGIDLNHLPSFASGQVLRTDVLTGYSLDTHVTPDAVLFQGDDVKITKAQLANLDIPQFRLVSVGEGHDVNSTLVTLEKVACWLREGGVVVLQGAGDWHSQTRLALHQFFLKHAGDSLSLFLVVKNKVFLCPSESRDRLLADLTNHPSVRNRLSFRQNSDSNYGIFSTYLTVSR